MTGERNSVRILIGPRGYRGRHARRADRGRHPRGVRGLVSAGVAVAAGAALLVAGPAGAIDGAPRVDLRVLVVTDGSAGVDAMVAQLDREGVPYDSLDVRAAGRPELTAARLAAAADHGRYQGVVLPTEAALSAAERTVLADYERRFAVRRIVSYDWAGPHVGMGTAWSGTLDGGLLTVTAAARAAGFGHLVGAVAVDDRDPRVAETYASLGAAATGADFTPLVTAVAPGGAGSGAVVGVHRHDGREELVLTVALNRYQTHGLVLAHGLVNWLTRGVHLGHWRNWFSLHVDDVFLPDNRWHRTENCTVGDDCRPDASPIAPDIRMAPSDVDKLLLWQRGTGIKLDLAFNGGGSVEAGAMDLLTAKLVATRSEFRWINHTFEHPYLGCVKDYSVTPWRCATDPATGAVQWVPMAEIADQITRNNGWARGKGIAVDDRELVTGEHSGLRALPQMPQDNPNLAPALEAAEVRFVASDASRESGVRTVGPARTVPRHPMNIFYNVATVAEEVDEYNWIYTSRADGGSGICETHAASTCIAPLGLDGFGGYIVPTEARIAFDHVVSADPRPHYAHQSNLAEDRVLYPVLDRLLARYRATFTTATPLVNPRFLAVGQLMRRQERWRAAVAAGTVTGYRRGADVTVVNTGPVAVDVPATVPAGTRTLSYGTGGVEVLGNQFGEAYGGQRSAWHGLARQATLTLRLPS